LYCICHQKPKQITILNHYNQMHHTFRNGKLLYSLLLRSFILHNIEKSKIPVVCPQKILLPRQKPMQNYFYIDGNFSAASRISSRLPKAVSRKKPSPPEPKPAPGVPTMFAFESRWSKYSQEDMLSGHCIQI
jgi:hypothetical protein